MKNSKFNKILFAIGLSIYLIGLIILIWTILYQYNFNLPSLTSKLILALEIIGSIFFLLGFIIFIISIILMYKQGNIIEKNYELVIEGKADIITIMLMTYVLIFMLVICLILGQNIGALLFGLTIIIQNILNILLIRYFSKGKDKKI